MLLIALIIGKTDLYSSYSYHIAEELCRCNAENALADVVFQIEFVYPIKDLLKMQEVIFFVFTSDDDVINVHLHSNSI